MKRTTKQIKISRYHGVGDVADNRWKELISALALAGYEVYADEEMIVFDLGDDDEVKEIKE